MNKKISVGASIALILLAISLAISATMVIAMRQFNRSVNEVVQRRSMYAYVDDVDTIVRGLYDNIDEEQLRQSLAGGYCAGIGDAYAAYLTADQYQSLLNARTGQATDFGLDVTLNAETVELTVTTVYADSAAAVAGVQVGDVITAINGQEFTISSYTAAVATLKNSEEVLLTVARSNELEEEPRALSFELTASSYALSSVQTRQIGAVGYVRVLSFKDNTADQFKKAVADLQMAGVSGFIFDLRGNADGVLQAALDSIAYLMPRGTYARQIETRGGINSLTSEGGYELMLPSVVLVNGATSGEAELFAGVLQEFGRAVVIGETTAGKAAVQEYFPLPSDNSALRLTTSTLNLVQGGSWQDVGILPNAEVTLAHDLAPQIGLLNDADDTQLTAALNWFAEQNIVVGEESSEESSEESAEDSAEQSAGESADMSAEGSTEE